MHKNVGNVSDDDDGDVDGGPCVPAVAVVYAAGSPLLAALVLPVVVLLRQVRVGSRRQEPLLPRFPHQHRLHILLPLYEVTNESTMFYVLILF